jgi:hypothetical protein
LCCCSKREKKEQKKQKKFLPLKKNLLLKKKVLAVETKERTKDKKRVKKVSISAAVLSLFCVTIFVSRFASLSKV